MNTRNLYWNRLKDLAYEKAYLYELQLKYGKLRLVVTILLGLLTSGSFTIFVSSNMYDGYATIVLLVVDCFAIIAPYFELTRKTVLLSSMAKLLEHLYFEAEAKWVDLCTNPEWDEKQAGAEVARIASWEHSICNFISDLGMEHDKKVSDKASKIADAQMDLLYHSTCEPEQNASGSTSDHCHPVQD